MAHGQTGMEKLSCYSQTERKKRSEFTLLTLMLAIYISRNGKKIEINSLFAGLNILKSSQQSNLKLVQGDYLKYLSKRS